VTIGQALAEARHRAGLTVAEVSEQTRIREKIIRAIEDDDYSTCGGDFYARGNIRSIAKVVGTDSEPLIQEYDALHRAPGPWSAVSLDELLATSEQAPPPPGRDRPAAPTPAAPPPGRDRPAAPPRAAPPRVAAAETVPGHGLAAAADLAGVAYTTVRLWLSRSAAGRVAGSAASETRRYLTWIVVLGVVLIVAVGFGGYFLLASPQRAAVTPSAASKHTAVGHDAARSKPKPAIAAPSPAAAAPSPAAAAPPQRLVPVSVAAFGPGGGDNPQLARQAIGGQPGGGWRTDWYSTARFGNLYPGTGLLLDMGRPVTLTAAQVALGRVRGANLQIRVGAAPALAGLQPVAHAADAGGVVRFRFAAPARGRYVLIWFTRLPADPSGTFQAQVWNVRLDGRA
jgi:Helix-turn-helix domain